MNKTPAEMGAIAAEKLNGTCEAIYSLGEEFEELEMNSEFCAALDARVFCCDGCNWWFEQPEMAEGSSWVCEGCA